MKETKYGNEREKVRDMGRSRETRDKMGGRARANACCSVKMSPTNTTWPIAG